MNLLNYLKESRHELQKVSWPSRPEVVKLTAVVLAVSLATALYLGLLDAIFVRLTKFLINLKQLA